MDIIEHEPAIRGICFLTVFTVMAAWESLAPRRPLSSSKSRRWTINIGLVIINTLVLRSLFSTATVGAALLAKQGGWGILNHWDPPLWISLPAVIVTLDFIIYLQHVIFHAVPVFWRLHMVHHADLDLDVSSGTRFHPIEMMLSMGIKLVAIALIGAPPVSVMIFELLLNMTAMFNHSNVQIPKKIDVILRLFIVTPDMHLIHHSIIRKEANSNFGFNLSWWDRLFGTYLSDPREGYQGMSIGLDQLRNPKDLTLPKILVLPFIGKMGSNTLSQDERDL